MKIKFLNHDLDCDDDDGDGDGDGGHQQGQQGERGCHHLLPPEQRYYDCFLLLLLVLLFLFLSLSVLSLFAGTAVVVAVFFVV